MVLIPVGFESFVNSDRCKALELRNVMFEWFESFVNSDRCKANLLSEPLNIGFESFVNSDRCKANEQCGSCYQ